MLESEFVGKFHNKENDFDIYWFRVSGGKKERRFYNTIFGVMEFGDVGVCVDDEIYPLRLGKTAILAVEPIMTVTDEMRSI